MLKQIADEAYTLESSVFQNFVQYQLFLSMVWKYSGQLRRFIRHNFQPFL